MALSRGRVARLTCRAVPLDGEQCSPAGARFQGQEKKVAEDIAVLRIFFQYGGERPLAPPL